jgi:methyltransferase (TIGR00027 family)
VGDEPLGAVSRTAVGVARVRAAESARPDRLFDDPFAAGFAAAFEDGTTSATPADLRAALRVHIVIRTRFYDDYLRAAVADGVRQVVLLGAGLDARAWRLPWETGVHLFEVDLPEVLAAKDALVTGLAARAACRRTAVPVDLRGDWTGALGEAGLSAAEPTTWLAEGLLVYLSADDAAAVLDGVDALSATGSQIAFESGGSARSQAGRADASADSVSSLWQGGVEDPTRWLESRQWSTAVHRLTALAASYGRPISTESASAFVTATKSPC